MADFIPGRAEQAGAPIPLDDVDRLLLLKAADALTGISLTADGAMGWRARNLAFRGLMKRDHAGERPRWRLTIVGWRAISLASRSTR
jgi:hypothetical protein